MRHLLRPHGTGVGPSCCAGACDCCATIEPPTVALLVSTPSFTNTSTVASDSISPAADSLLVVWVAARAGATGVRSVTGITTTLANVGAWTIGAPATVAGATDRLICTPAWAQVTGNPGTGTVTATLNTTMNRRVIHVAQVLGHDLSAPVTQGSASTGTTGASPSVTLGAAPAGSSLLLACLGVYAATAAGATGITSGTDWTELAESDAASGGAHVRSQLQSWPAPTDGVADWTIAGTGHLLTARGVIEVAAA